MVLQQTKIKWKRSTDTKGWCDCDFVQKLFFIGLKDYMLYIGWKAGCQQCRKVRGTHTQVPQMTAVSCAVHPWGPDATEVSQGYNHALFYILPAWRTAINVTFLCNLSCAPNCRVTRGTVEPSRRGSWRCCMSWGLFVARSGTDRPARCSR